jgi:ketosteroid isomerase-like protein
MGRNGQKRGLVTCDLSRVKREDDAGARARRVFEDFFPFDAVTVEPEAFFEGNGQIVAFFLQRSKPKGSNAFVEARAAHIWTIRDGKATRLEIFPQRERALKAAGLSE